MSLWVLAFFGLTSKIAPQVRMNLFSQVHQIIFYGKGGYDYDTVYHMPIWLRKFTFNEIKKFYEEEKAASEGKTPNGQTDLVGKDGKINKPEFTRVSKPHRNKSSYK